MKIDKKLEVISAAITSAEKNGFDFQTWYTDKLNIGNNWRIPTIQRIKHMIHLGIEDSLILDKQFAKALNQKNWLNYLQAAVVNDSRIYYLWQYLVKYGILEA